MFIAGSGISKSLAELALVFPGGKWGVIIFIQIIWILMGCFLDSWGILMITGPIFIPIIRGLGFDMVWFGVVFVINMEMALLTPPFGFNLFFMKGVTPPNISMSNIIHSVWPFIGIQLLCLILVLIFPEIILWLPSKMPY